VLLAFTKSIAWLWSGKTLFTPAAAAHGRLLLQQAV